MKKKQVKGLKEKDFSAEVIARVDTGKSFLADHFIELGYGNTGFSDLTDTEHNFKLVELKEVSTDLIY